MKTPYYLFALWAIVFLSSCPHHPSPIEGIWELAEGVKYTTITDPGGEPDYSMEPIPFSLWHFTDHINGYKSTTKGDTLPFTYEIEEGRITVSPTLLGGGLWRGTINKEGQGIHLYSNFTLEIESWTSSTTEDLKLVRHQWRDPQKVHVTDSEETDEY